MNFGIYMPNFGDYSDPIRLGEFAVAAEEAGWDGVFLYDHLVADAYGIRPDDGLVNPWIALAAIALLTKRIRLGPLVTPVARRRPWQLASEIVSLDHLSGGRVIFGAGLGGEAVARQFGEDADAKVRARELDEGLEIMTGLWSGRPFKLNGQRFRVDASPFLPTPVQSPRVPIWIGGVWPNKPPFRRAAKWDGVFPLTLKSTLPSAAQIREIARYVTDHRTVGGEFDLAVAGMTNGPSDIRAVAESSDAGATWWLERLKPQRGSVAEMRFRIRAGPPKL